MSVLCYFICIGKDVVTHLLPNHCRPKKGSPKDWDKYSWNWQQSIVDMSRISYCCCYSYTRRMGMVERIRKGRRWSKFKDKLYLSLIVNSSLVSESRGSARDRGEWRGKESAVSPKLFFLPLGHDPEDNCSKGLGNGTMANAQQIGLLRLFCNTVPGGKWYLYEPFMVLAGPFTRALWKGALFIALLTAARRGSRAIHAHSAITRPIK